MKNMVFLEKMLVVINHIMEKELKVNLAGQIMIAIVKKCSNSVKICEAASLYGKCTSHSECDTVLIQFNYIKKQGLICNFNYN